MKKPIFLTVALAAALASFAASAAEVPNIPRTPLFSTQKAAATAQKAKPRAKMVEKATSSKAAASKAPAKKPAIARTPLFPMQKTATETANAAGGTGKAKAQAAAKTPKAKNSKRKTARLDTKKAKQTAKVSRGKARSTVTMVTETTIKAKTASGYPVKSDTLAPAKSGRPYHAVIARYATEFGVPVSLAHAVISVESNYRPNSTGSAGEVGLMQIKPATARGLGYSGSVAGLYNPETNIRFGMKYLAMAHQLGGGTTCGTILKYNAGHGASRMNPVSKAYCGKVQRLLAS